MRRRVLLITASRLVRMRPVVSKVTSVSQYTNIARLGSEDIAQHDEQNMFGLGTSALRSGRICFRRLQLDLLCADRVIEHPQQETEYSHHLAIQQSGRSTPSTRSRILKTKDRVVSQSISLECNADCTDSVAPVPMLLLLGFVDLVVAGRLVVCDDPFVSETRLINVMIPKSRRGDFRCEDGPLLHACDRVDAESPCEFHLESRKVARMTILIRRKDEDVMATHPTSKYRRGCGIRKEDDF